MQSLAESYHEAAATSYLGHPTIVQVLHEAGSWLSDVIACAELPAMIDSPAVNIAFLSHRHSKTVANGHLHGLALNFLDAMRSQKLTECASAPQEKIPRGLLRNRGTETSSCDESHWNVRYLVDQLETVRLASCAIA